MKIAIARSLSHLPITPLISRKTWGVQGKLNFPLFKPEKNLKSCDLILIPHDSYYFHSERYYYNYLRSLSQEKTLLIPDLGDFPKNLNIKNAILLRHAVAPGENMNNKIIIPYNIQSLSRTKLLRYTTVPKVSFVGYRPTFLSPNRFIKSLSWHSPHPLLNNASYVRYKSIKKIVNQIENNFVIIRNYPNASIKNHEQFLIERKEYKDSISDSNIVLCPRGDGNQSQRFYETISAGRVPLIPFTKIIYPKIIEKSDFLQDCAISFNLCEKHLDQRVLEFWQSFQNNKNYLEFQTNVRSFYVKNLIFSKFMKKMFSLEIENFWKFYEISL